MYRRNPDSVYSAITRTGDKVIANEDGMKMIFPSRWLERSLAVIEATITVLGYVAIARANGDYAVSKVSGFFRTVPSRISKEVFGEESYTVFWYDKGAPIINNTEIVKLDNLVHTIYGELLGKGRVPWYYNYMDRLKLFENIGYYNGVDKNGDPVLWSYMAATMSRDPDNTQQYYRHREDPTADMFTHPPVSLGLTYVSYHGTSIFAKQGGSYFDAGSTSALANPAKRVERTDLIFTQT